jgi:hypothetical protein
MARTLAMAGRQPTLLLGMVEGPEPTDNGLGVDAYVNPARTDVQDLVTAIDDGNVTQMSFAFMLIEGWWSDDFETFKITEVDIHRGDVSAVNYGANPFTSIEARQQEILADVRNMPASAARAAFRELMARNDLDLDTLMRAYEISETRAKAASRTQVVVVDTDDDDDEMDDDVLACPSCGAGNEADASFCDQCGASMDGAQMLAATPAGHSVRTASGMPEATGRSLLHIEALLAE